MENNPTYVEHSENPVETAGTQGEDIVAQSVRLLMRKIINYMSDKHYVSNY